MLTYKDKKGNVVMTENADGTLNLLSESLKKEMKKDAETYNEKEETEDEQKED